MKISRTSFRGRAAWELNNDALRLVVLAGGGHLASLTLVGPGAVNPLWQPPWPTQEPWAYREASAKRFGSRLLASIAGHNPCLGWFGDGSAEETLAGMGCHGEAPVVRWRLVRRSVTAGTLRLVCACDMPVAQLRLTRTITLRRGERVVDVHEEIENRSRRDLPFTWCQHVTVGPPFLDASETVFDMPATQGHTFPTAFSDRQRLKADTAFTWPAGPGADGRAVDLRRLGSATRRSSDFSAQLIDPRRELAWFSALNPRLGLLLAYAWRRADFPWVGNWEENRARRAAPWSGKTLSRGMEFANTPFPAGLRAAVDRGQFQGMPTFRWVPARGKVAAGYTILLLPVDAAAKGVSDIRLEGDRPVVRLLE